MSGMLRYRHRQSSRTPFKIAVVALLVGIFAVSPVFELYNFQATVNAASAADASGPKQSWLGNHAARYRLENTSSVQGAGTQYIPIYIENTGSDTDPETYPPTNSRIRASDFSQGYIGTNFLNVRFFYCDGTTYAGGSSSTQSSVDFTIPKECFTYVPTINAWTTDIRAVLQGSNGGASFRLNFISPNDGHQLFGYSTKNSNRGFAVSNRYRCDFYGDRTGCWSYYNYRIPFGVPCSEQVARNVTASIYDGDNTTGNQYGIQGPLLFSVAIYDVTAGRFISHSTSGGAGNNQLQTYTFRVEPEHRYQFRVNNVYTNNVLQFRLPFNSIEYYNDCGWDLNPTVTVDPDTSEGDTNGLNVEYFMPNEGPSVSDPVDWQLSRCVVNAGTSSAAYSEVSDNTSNGTNTYNALGASCSQVTSRTNQTFARSDINRIGGLTNQSIPDLEPGSRVCYVLSVNPPTEDAPSNRWRHSIPACVVIGKKPKVQVLGGDLMVGRNFAGVTGVPISDIQTATTSKSISGESLRFGSWGEYAVSATGTVVSSTGKGFAAGSGYAGGTDRTLICQVSLLTIANTDTTSPCSGGAGLGNYRTNRSIPDVAGAFVTSSSTPALSGSVSLTGRDGLYRATGNITITGGSIARGDSVVINAPGRTVTITGDITYDNGPIDDIEDIPQVVIIAQDIRIRGVSSATAVRQVDAWLVARGTLNTCYDANSADTLTINRCSTRLTVNGPVMASNLELWRTAGSGSGNSAGNPAEVFNLRPDAYLWGVYQASNSGRLESVYERELPPRF